MRGIRMDLAGQRFNRFRVVRFWRKNKHHQSTWLCRCDCGNTRIIRGGDLTSGNTKSCGCLAAKINELGNRYERLVIIAEAETVNSNAMWLCKCDCGNETVVSGSNLRSGSTKSCGCLGIDKNSARQGNKNPAYIDGSHYGWGAKEQKEFAESIRKRDNYTCQECGKTQDEQLKEFGSRLSVHHKDGNHFDNRDENATTLCA